MKIVESVASMQSLRHSWSKRVGFVPTMGALHEGHATLIKRARTECEHVCVSLFVNPTQFNDPQDLDRYPKPKEQDLVLLRTLDVDAVFAPPASEIYSDNYRFSVHESLSAKILCGAKRPGHFAGVLTVVLKLLNLVRPHKAYFGEKDFQQLRLIQEMVQAFFLPSEIVACPTVREADGLAMSSRNLLLSATERELAPALYHILVMADSASTARQQLHARGFKVDYVEEHWGRRFGAAFLGPVRLIDNVEL